MKLSISTLGCPGWGLQKIVDTWSRLGVEGIEVRGIGGVMDAEKIEAFLPQNAESTKALLACHGLKLVGFGTSAKFHDRKKHEENVAQAKGAIDVCVRMGIPSIRVFGNNVDPSIPEQSLEAIVDGLSQVCEYAENTGIGVNLEIHGDVNTADRLRTVTTPLSRYRSFGIIWDICHTFSSVGNQYEEIYGVIAPFVRHVHIKDGVRGEKGVTLCSVGKGEIDIRSVVRRLLSDGYDGYFSLEHEKMWHSNLAEPEEEFPRFVEYMKTL